MRHNQASHAGLSLQHRQDLCSIRRCFSPKALDITFHSFPYYFPVPRLDFGTPEPCKPPPTGEPVHSEGGRGNNKKVGHRKTGLQVWREPGLGSFPSPGHGGSSREPQCHQPPKTRPTTQPPGKREGGRARQERQNPAFDQPPSTTHYASKRKDQATCLLTENKKNISSKTFSCENNPLRGQPAL